MKQNAVAMSNVKSEPEKVYHSPRVPHHPAGSMASNIVIVHTTKPTMYASSCTAPPSREKMTCRTDGSHAAEERTLPQQQQHRKHFLELYQFPDRIARPRWSQMKCAARFRRSSAIKVAMNACATLTAMNNIVDHCSSELVIVLATIAQYEVAAAPQFGSNAA